MNSILIKILATALTLSQVTGRPEDMRTTFDPDRDRAEVVQILKDGCAHMRRAFDIEEINIDDLITTAMDDPQAITGDTKVLQGISFTDLHTTYRQYCKDEKIDAPPVDLGEVITYYNAALADLPDHNALKGLKLPGVSTVLDGRGEPFTEVYDPDHRRIWVPLSAIPEPVQRAFIAAEDKRFYQHKGVDERGIIRAFIGNLTQPGRPQGGSTITQQVIKNLLVGDDVTYERKMREMVLAARAERILSKAEILEIYLNSIYLGRSSWGIEMAARSYFGKSARELDLREGALLASLAKGPNYYNPDRYPDRSRERLAYVLNRMQEDGAISADEDKQALAEMPHLATIERQQRDSGFYFLDHVNRDAKTLAGIEGLTAASYTVRTTLNPQLQRAAETALQDGLARYELATGRQRFAGPEANLGDAIRRRAAETKASDSSPIPTRPVWQQALSATRLPLYDLRWPAAVVVEKGRDKKTGGEVIRVGLSDGRVMPLTTWSAADRRRLQLYDVIRIRIIEAKGKAARAEMRMVPSVQGAAVVLENRTGRILAMAGGFSYPLSQLNRTTQAHRQPGSALKPITYLAALAHGLQPNTLVWDTPVTLPPIGGDLTARPQDYWTPKNYDGGSSGIITLRRALENSKNLVTARLLDGGIAGSAEQSLKRVCELALEAQLYLECVPHYPFVLGAQPLRLIDLAAFYAAIASEGARPSPYAIESIDQEGRTLYRRNTVSPTRIGSADQAAFYQLKTILQGVLERGTARSIRKLAPYVAGKTGTTDDENDTWFVGFTNDVTVAAWVGYDNADGKRRTLGRGQTGAKIAIPIVEPILEATWKYVVPKTVLNPPSAEASRHLVSAPIDLMTGDRITDGRKGFTEYFRADRWGQLADTQYRLVPETEVYAFRSPEPWSDGEGGLMDDPYQAPYGQAPSWFEPPRVQAPATVPWWEDQSPRRRPQRVDPDYFWGRGPVY